MKTKRCVKCFVVKDISMFWKNSHKRDGIDIYCKSCLGYTGERKRIYLSGEVIDGKKLCTCCMRYLELIKFNKACSVSKSGLDAWCRNCRVWKTRVARIVLRMEMIIAYGGKCTCAGCNEYRIEFLTLEHINSKGRDKVSVGYMGWRNLKSLGWPKDNYTVMCYNCNQVRRHGNICPHDKEKHNAYLVELERFVGIYYKNNYSKLRHLCPPVN